MAFDRFLIAPLQTGLQTDLRPFLIPDDAFEVLENAYVFRGRVRKRFGSFLMGSGTSGVSLNQLNSRFRIGIGTTDSVTGNFTSTVPGIIWQMGQMFSVGNTLFTVYQTTGVTYTTGAATATYDTTSGALVITGNTENPSTAVYFYPSQPVMGLDIFANGPINNQPTYGFDTQFAYIFVGGSWQRSGSGSTPIWHGTDINFFWSASYRAAPGVKALFVSNFYAVNPNGASSGSDDPVWYLNSVSNAWTALTPLTLAAGNTILTARIIVPFKDRLVFLNTIEVSSDGDTNTNFVNRCRFSQVGDPTATNAFLEVTQVGALGGGFIDASTDEAIITAEFIKDRLMVYFERSTWELAFTGNGVVPFQWNRINTELGSESTFSVVPFDKQVLAIGSTGVHACNGANVERIDDKIPDTIFQIKNQNVSTARVSGIRDYLVETVYWTYPSFNERSNEVYPNKVLVYNYKNQTWAQNDDCITAFGYFEQGSTVTWASSTPQTWDESTEQWNSGFQQPQPRQVIAGNQQGYTFLILPDLGRNAPVMQLTNVSLAGTVLTLTIINHTLQASNIADNGDYIRIEQAQGAINLNALTALPINLVVDENTVTVITPVGFTLGGAYTGGGLITRVSNILIRSKQWNPYDKEGQNVYLARIDFSVLKTGNGEITVDYFPSASNQSMIQAGTATQSIMGTSILETFPYDPVLYPFEQVQQRLWHAVYFQTTGECIQIYMHFSDAEMRNVAISWELFEMEALILYTSRASSRLQ